MCEHEHEHTYIVHMPHFFAVQSPKVQRSGMKTVHEKKTLQVTICTAIGKNKLIVQLMRKLLKSRIL